MNYKEVIEYLYSLDRKKGSKLGLENIQGLLSELGNPEKDLKVIHVAGTNGKGSVCAMISSILQHAGFKVGMYTSPHLKDFKERFMVNNFPITEDNIVDYFLKVKDKITEQTFFEVITAMAFLYFKDKEVDYLVLEVGLGGRLDATNVVKPLVSVITNIDIEHTDFLGETIEKIAYEKAGIIKENIPVVTGATGKALEEIQKIADKKNAELFEVTQNGFEMNLKGEFQQNNASIAVKVIKILNKKYSLNISKQNIEKGFLNINWHGRFEFLKENILTDCAHNPSAFENLVKELEKLEYKRLIIVVGILKDKDINKMMSIIKPLASKIFITKPETPRAAEPSLMEKSVKDKDKVKIIENVKEAFEEAKKISKKNDLILVTGSCFVVGEVY